MKKIIPQLLIGTVLLYSAANIHGQTVSAGSGNWSDPLTWSTGVPPTGIFEILAGHEVTMNDGDVIETGNSVIIRGTLNLNAGSSMSVNRINNNIASEGSVNINGGTLTARRYSPNAAGDFVLTLNSGTFRLGDQDFPIALSHLDVFTFHLNGGKFIVNHGNLSSSNTIHLGEGANLIFENTPNTENNNLLTIGGTAALTVNGSWTGGTLTTNTRSVTGGSLDTLIGVSVDVEHGWNSNPSNVIALSSEPEAQTLTWGSNVDVNQGTLAFKIYSDEDNNNDQLVMDGAATLSLGAGVQLQISGHELSGDAESFIGTAYQLFSASNYAGIQATIMTETLVIDGSGYGVIWTNNLASNGTVIIEDLIPVAVTGVSLEPAVVELEIDVDETRQLTATVAPIDATDSSVSWSSSDETVATVDASGLVTAVAEGSATITVTTNDGGFTATAEVIVEDNRIFAEGINVLPESLVLSIGGNQQMSIEFDPEDALPLDVTWSSDNDSVATVSETGLVTAHASGNATITATTVGGAFSSSATITVEAPPVPPFQETVAGEATGNPDEYNSTWFGLFQTSENHHHWVWHEGLGWLYAGYVWSDVDMWLWSQVFEGYIYTEVGLFPFIQVNEDEWIYYRLNNGAGSYFSFNAEVWFAIGD